MEEFFVLIGVLGVVVGLPWVLLHYITKWKTAPKITVEDENMLDEMYNLARRLEDRMNTVERIVAADNPEWRPGLGAPQQPTYQIDRRN
jgi:phage shock protein B